MQKVSMTNSPLILPPNFDKQRSIHKVVGSRELFADTLPHIIEYTKFLEAQGWSAYGGVKIVKNGHPSGKGDLFIQVMVCYSEERLE